MRREKRLKIYYRYSTLDKLNMTRGDLINECNCLEALNDSADVYYGHRKYLGNYMFADDKTPQKYDAYIIRANAVEFLKIPEGEKKVWVASPYDLRCFRQADILATFTTAWETALKEGTFIPGLNPNGKIFGNAMSIDQCLGAHINKSNVDQDKVSAIRKSLGDGLIIGHFGRVAKTNYPSLLQSAWPKIRETFGKVTLLAGSTKDKFPIAGAVQRNILYKNIQNYISACDMIIINQRGAEWDYCGNLKVKEAMACGVPVILQRSKARVEELGEDYQLFMPRGSMNENSRTIQVTRLIRKIRKARDAKERISRGLLDSADRYSMESAKKRWKSILKNLVTAKRLTV